MITAFCRQCSLWILPPVRVRDSLTSSARALIMPRLGCRMGASSAREVSMLLVLISRRRRCGVACAVEGGVAWAWTELPAMIVARIACCGCVMSDGRFAVLGGIGLGASLSSCEALVFGAAAHWEPLQPMHDSRYLFACAAVAGCVIVAGGAGRTSAELYDESRNRWLRLPHDLPYENELRAMGSALL
jgi:hypothetical protein